MNETVSPFQPGDRIKLVAMPNDPNPIRVGSTGTVTNAIFVGGRWQVWVKWDLDRSLALCIPPDIAEKVG